MKIKILGTRGEIEESSPYHAKKSGVLINDELLLDCGDERFLAYNPQAILITHLHPDHAYFVRHYEVPATSAPIYAPESYDLCTNMHITNKKFRIGSYSITPIPTIHSIKVKSNAYLIEYKKQRLLYTGDMIWIEKKYHHILRDLDCVITEASFMRKGGIVRRKEGKIFGHTGVPNLIQLFKQFTSTMIFVHFGAWFYKDIKKARAEFKRLAKEHGINVIVGYEGLEIKL